MSLNQFTQMFPSGVENSEYAKFFTGTSYLAPLVSNKEISASNVTFEAGCRNNWHIHHGVNQVLICTAGEGWYQVEGQKAQKLKGGDVVDIPAGVKHWHGAAKDSWFSHIAIMPLKEGASNEWCGPVSDDEYLAVHSN